MLLCDALLAVLLSAPARAADLELKVSEIPAPIALDPFDAAWAKIPQTQVPLMPQIIAPPGGGGAVKTMGIKALQCRRELFVLLEWADPRPDEYPSPAERFSDAVAVQFPAQPGTWPSPFMGEKGKAVVIWRWSASAQKDLDAGYQGSRAERQRTTADLYAFAGDATFRAGEAAGNIVSRRRRDSAVESLHAEGFGTLTASDDQAVHGKGVWREGRWHVLFRRDLNGTPSFARGSRLAFALAAWDGSAGERDGMKSASIWHTLAFPGAGPRQAETAVAAGGRHFLRYGCATCHGKGGAGGIPNPNAQVDPIPALNRAKEGFSKEEIVTIVLKGREPARADPAGAPPRFRMNAWEAVMSPAEAGTIADYLFSLMPEEKSEW